VKEESALLSATAAKLEDVLAVVESGNGAMSRTKFTISAEGRARIAAAQRKRWKAVKAKKGAA
jgi:hypothetical protein